MSFKSYWSNVSNKQTVAKEVMTDMTYLTPLTYLTRFYVSLQPYNSSTAYVA
jgi:hypothetical protein